MRIATRIRSLFRTLFRKDALNRDLRDELDSYLSLLVDEKIRAGMHPDEARRAARLELGGVEQVRQSVAERRLGASLDGVLRDIRFAFRQFRRNPGFTTVAILTLALGIGANTAVFSVVSQVLLRPLPYAAEDRVFVIENGYDEGSLDLSEQEFLEYRSLPVIEALGVYESGTVALTGEGAAERVPAVFADHAALAAVGAQVIAGRSLEPDDDIPNGAAVALLSEGLWERRFARDPDLVGRTAVINGIPRTVLGILPAGFRLPTGFATDAPDVILPIRVNVASPDERNIHYLNGVARLAPGVSVGQARTALHEAARGLHDRLGTLPETFTATAVPVREAVIGSVRPVLLILLGAVALVLLVACVNVANLLLARADTRTREMAVRLSLGAGQGRLIRQLSTETGVLALIGGVSGLGIGLLGAQALISLRPPGLPRLDGLVVDLRIFFFCALATLVTGLLVGLLPALRVSRGQPAGALKGTRGSTSDGAGSRTRRALVMAQVALAAMLTIGAGLLVRSFVELRAVDPGFESGGVLTFETALPSADYATQTAARGYFDRLTEELGEMPGVEAVGATTALPLANSVGDWGVRIRGRGPDGLGERGPAPDWMVVTPGYFAALRIPTVAGRTFDRSDVEGGRQTVVISELFASRHWPEGDALGAQIRMSTDIDTIWRTVVGIVGDVRHASLAEDPRPAMYLPHAQFPSTSTSFSFTRATVAVRTSAGDPAALAAPVRQVAAGLDPDVPVARLRTMGDIARSATASERFQGVLFGGFAALALVLVIVGVYGVTSYLVAQRRREIGIRMALGATPGGVRGLVLREGMTMAGIGLLAGVTAAWALSRLVSGLLYGVSARDPVTFLAVPLLLALTVLVSTLVPAVRAARVDPLRTLRHD